jgi:hypothetical protein
MYLANAHFVRCDLQQTLCLYGIAVNHPFCVYQRQRLYAKQIGRGASSFELLRHLLVRMDNKRPPLVTLFATKFGKRSHGSHHGEAHRLFFIFTSVATKDLIRIAGRSLDHISGGIDLYLNMPKRSFKP